MLTVLAVLSAVGIERHNSGRRSFTNGISAHRLGRPTARPGVVEKIVRRRGHPRPTWSPRSGWSASVFAISADLPRCRRTWRPPRSPAPSTKSSSTRRSDFRYDGTLDKYMGDGLIAVFGAPVTQSDHAERAVPHRSADAAGTGGAEPKTRRPPAAVHAAIGINSGPVTAGDIGSPQAQRLHGDRRYRERCQPVGIDGRQSGAGGHRADDL